MCIFIKREKNCTTDKTGKRMQKRFDINWRLTFKHWKARIIQTGEQPEKGSI